MNSQLSPQSFEWDAKKNKANIAKHGISFEQAKEIFEGVTLSEEVEYRGEARIITTGLYQKIAIIVVIHTDRHGKIRIISARPASRKERQRYRHSLQ